MNKFYVFFVWVLFTVETFSQVDSITLINDGPYVFYRDNKIVVKQVRENVYKYETFTRIDEVRLICRVPNKPDSFLVNLQVPRNVEKAVYKMSKKCLITSDIEGNFDAFVLLLKSTGIMNNEYKWKFGSGHLVFLGDMFDRGQFVTECLWLLYKLEYEAEAAGGKVHFILGNHDIMNLIHDFRYVVPKYTQSAELMGETLKSVYASDTELGRWLRTKNIIEKMGNLVLVHAGISPEVANLKLSYEEMNRWGRYRMDSVCKLPACAAVTGGSKVGLYWYRAMAEQKITQTDVDSALIKLDANRVIIGHTIMDSIHAFYNNKVIAIDLDHEENFKNKATIEALYYEKERFYRFIISSKKRKKIPLSLQK